MTKSIFNSSARSVTSEPFPVSEETITTGIGRRHGFPENRGRPYAASQRRGSIRRIRIFDEITLATNGSGAVACLPVAMAGNNFSVIWRIGAESSTDNTLIL